MCHKIFNARQKELRKMTNLGKSRLFRPIRSIIDSCLLLQVSDKKLFSSYLLNTGTDSEVTRYFMCLLHYQKVGLLVD